MIGHTQGVNKAIRPPRKPNKKMRQRSFPPSPNWRSGSEMLNEEARVSDCVARIVSSIEFSARSPNLAPSLSCSSAPSMFFFAADVSPPSSGRGGGGEASPLYSNSTCVGGMHILSLHAPYSRKPRIWYLEPVILYFCTKRTLFSKKRNRIPNISS